MPHLCPALPGRAAEQTHRPRTCFATGQVALCKHTNANANADWAHVGNRDLPAAAGVCPSWFPRSRQVHLEWEDFQLAWCVGGVVARADQAAAPNGQPTLTFLLDASTV